MSKRKDCLGRERVCPVCKKTFLLPPLNVYKINNRNGDPTHYCSYTCFRTVQKKMEEGKPYRIDHSNA